MPSSSGSEDENTTLLYRKYKTGCCRIPFYGPDSAWSWLVAFANFFVNFIIVGLGRMSGILYVEFMYIFNIDRTTASIPFSVQQAGRNLFGPVAGILTQKYGLRPVTILGGIIGSLSAAIIYYKMDVMSITILWGLFFGISTALTTTLNQISIDQYFEKHKASAGGFSFSGGCLGAFFFPIVIETLIEHYSMRGTFLVLGSIILFVLPAAMMLIDPPWRNEQKTIKQITMSYGALEVGEPSTSDNSIEKLEKNIHVEVGGAKILPIFIDFTTLQENSDMVFQFLTMDLSDKSMRQKLNESMPERLDKKRLLDELECLYASVANLQEKSLNNELPSGKLWFNIDEESDSQDLKVYYKSNDNEKMMNEGDDYLPRLLDYDIPRRVYIQTKLKELHVAKGLQLVSRFPYSDQVRAWKIIIELQKLYEILNDTPVRTNSSDAPVIHESRHKIRDKTKKTPDMKKRPNTFCSHIKTGIKLHANPLFLLICLCRAVFMLTFIPVVTVVVDFAMDKGLPKSEGKYVISILSLGDFIGRLCLGWITDRGCLSLPRYMLIVMVILGGSSATLPFMTSSISFMTSILIFGILQGSLFVRHPLLVSHYMESHEQSIGMGFINFFSGFLGFALPAFIGYFRDRLGSYDNMFYLNGAICTVVGLIWILEPLFLSILTCNSCKSDKTLV